MIETNEPILAEKQERILQIRYKIEELREFEKKSDEFKKERDSWIEKRDNQRKHHQKVIQQIEEDKVIQIDNLRKEMLLQIRAVKIKMLNMNEDQLIGTTKLTVI